MSEANEAGFTIGAVAAQLGVAPETVRSWGRRYGVVPTLRTGGGHRRYTNTDLARLMRMQHLIVRGLPASQAARQVLTEPLTALDLGDLPKPELRRPRRTKAGRLPATLSIPSGSAEVRTLARAAARFDSDEVAELLRGWLAERGAALTWQIAAEVLIAIGQQWLITGQCVEIEHLLTEVVTDALREHRARQLRPLGTRPVLLGSYPEEIHVLPVHALAATLAEHRVAVRVLGAGVPVLALNAALQRAQPVTVFLWRQMRGEGSLRGLQIPRAVSKLHVIVGGPGWDDTTLPAGARRVDTLLRATTTVRATVQ